MIVSSADIGWSWRLLGSTFHPTWTPTNITPPLSVLAPTIHNQSLNQLRIGIALYMLHADGERYGKIVHLQTLKFRLWYPLRLKLMPRAYLMHSYSKECRWVTCRFLDGKNAIIRPCLTWWSYLREVSWNAVHKFLSVCEWDRDDGQFGLVNLKTRIARTIQSLQWFQKL